LITNIEEIAPINDNIIVVGRKLKNDIEQFKLDHDNNMDRFYLHQISENGDTEKGE